jgi:branched-chain amino acid transport system permease protein
VIWAIVGGTGTLFGPVLGTAVLIVLREELSIYWEHYLLVVGAIVILMVRYAPDGLIGLLQWFLAGHRKWESAPGPTVAKEGQP